ncbi:MAG: hypothetical protein ACOZQL_00655 [Myxococcota bacterium]
MLRSLQLAPLLLALVLFGSACSEDAPVEPPPPPPKPVVARLVRVDGQVWLTHEAKRSPAVAGPLVEGDLLETGADGHAVLSSGGREVELFEDSSFRVGRSLAVLSLESGELTFEDADGGEFNSAAGAARTGAGSRVRLSQRDGGTSFSVSEGSFEFIDGVDGGVSTVKPGERFVVGEGVLTLEELPTAPPAPVVEKPSLQLRPRGAVTLKVKNGKAEKLPAAGRALEEAGTFSVERGGQLRAERGGVLLQFDAASKGVVEPREGPPGVRALLQQGGLRVFLAAGESVLLDGKQPVTLRAKTTLTALVSPSKTGPRVEIVGGQAEAAVGDGLPRNLGAGEVATPKGKGLDTARRGAPVLTLPAGRASRVFWGRPSEVALALPPGDGPLEVSNEPDFAAPLVVAEVGEPLVVPAPLKGTLFWRRKGDPEASSARFEPDEHAATVAAKSDTVAETGLKATVYFQSAVPSLTFTFPPKEGAAAWRFRVYAVGDLKTALVDRKVTENRAVVESGALREGSYVWSAVALDRSGLEAPGGRMNKMDIVFDNSLTRLVLTSPKDGERASTAVGIAPLGSKLTLNGKPVPLDAAGRFSVPVGGSALLVFRLVTKDGAEAQWVRRLGR